MTYTPQHHEQDQKIAMHIYKKHFDGHYMKDDLIQTALIELAKLRKRGGYRNYVSMACDIAKKKMINLLKKENRHEFDSLNEFVGGDDEDLEINETVAIEQPTADEYCEYTELAKQIKPLMDSLSVRDKKIIVLHLKHYTQREIAILVKISQPYVSEIINKFRTTSRRILGDFQGRRI